MKSLTELQKIRDQVRRELEVRNGNQRTRVIVGMGTCGIAAGARDTMRAFMDEVDRAGLADVAVVAAGCAGHCEHEPLVEVVTDDGSVRYGNVDQDAARRIFQDHIQNGRVVDELVFTRG